MDDWMNGRVPTFHLPALTPRGFVEEFGEARLLVANLKADDIAALVCILRERAVWLRAQPMQRVIAALTEAAQRWLAEGSPYMRTTLDLLPRITGYSRPVIEHQLRHLLTQIIPDALKNLLSENEPPFPHHLPLVTCHLSLVTQFCAGNIPGLGIEAILFPLLAGTPTFIKASSGEPLLAALFADSLSDVDAGLGECLAVVWWEGGNRELELAACQLADVIVATGDDHTIEALRRLAPPTARFMAHPHKVSVGLVGKGYLTPETAAAIAKDVALFDQQGCLSPQVVFIETPSQTSAEECAREVRTALQGIDSKFPVGSLPISEIAGLQQSLATLEMSGALILRTSGICSRSVALPNASSPPTAYLRLRGGVFLQRIEDVSEVRHKLVAFSDRLQAVGTALPEQELANLTPFFYTLGVCRICPLGEMQTPPLGWCADGIDPVAGLMSSDHQT